MSPAQMNVNLNGSATASASLSPDPSAEPYASSEQPRTRRAYKACLHCRSRKAKCDLGDIDAPNKPPCARCRRERRECVFAPSFRGGKIVRKSSTTSPIANVGMNIHVVTDGVVPAGIQMDNVDANSKISTSASVLSATSFSPHSLSLDVSTIEASASTASSDSESGRPHKAMRLSSPSPHHSTSGTEDREEDRGLNRLDPQSLAAASLRNPTDALNLLALAADVDRASKSKSKFKTKGKRRDSRTLGLGRVKVGDDGRHGDAASSGSDSICLDLSLSSNGTMLSGNSNPRHHHHRLHHQRAPPSLPSLSSCALVREKVLTCEQLVHLTGTFFSRAHAVFPMISFNRIPSANETTLARFARDEVYLLTAIIVITSRQERILDVHERSWEYMQTLINELILGKVAAVGAVEALLLLSENLPRRSEPATEDEEHRMSWMLVGMAVRLGYMLGLDQKTLRPITPGGDDFQLNEKGRRECDEEDTMSENERLDRERLAWTYCYIFDRSISIRSGKAFWSRGPGLCFQPTHSGSMPTASESFPSLRPVQGQQDDFASMLQAYTELTQTMASAHDVLYPSKDRTIALVRVGDYHKYLDEFTRSINGFHLNWENKAWETSIVTDCVWLTFHYLRLYIYAFAFQAHVQRSTSTSQDGKKVADTVIFPRGPMGSPDARFILEAIDAATQLLQICVNKLHPSRTISYLPWRFYLYFSYAGVFLLKAVFVGAVVPQDQRTIVQLIKRVIICLASASPDEQHSGIRYARLLNGLLRVFSRGVDGVTSQVSTPKRKTLMELPLVPTSTVDQEDLKPAVAMATRALPMNGTGVIEHERHTRMEVNTSSQDHSRSIPQAHAETPTSGHPMHNGLCTSESSYYSAPHGALMTPTSTATNSAAQSFTSPDSSRFSHAPNTQQQQQQQQQHQLYAQPAHQHAGTPQYSANINGVNSGFDGLYPSSAHNVNFHFDLNWPPMEPDGLAQMLSDEHSLDGDFWMSLPSHAQWQSWPAGTTSTTSIN